jgi:RNA polymerase sigma factor (sigma-70 family)
MDWIRRRTLQDADAQDLLQETLLRTMEAAARRGVTDARQIEKTAQRIARNLCADEQRRNVRKPQTNRELEAATEKPGAGDPSAEAERTGETKALLRAVRARLEPHLGSMQRAVLAAYLDDDIVRVDALAARLGTTREHVNRIWLGIGKRLLGLGPLTDGSDLG